MSATTHILNRNMPYLRQQFSALLRNTSPVITLICLVTVVGYLLSFSETAVLYLTVTPGYILPNTEFWVWTAFTFCFMELHWWEVLVDVITVGLCGKMIEPLWGQMEMFKFFALSNIGVSVLTTMYYLFNYMITKNPLILFDVHIHGLAGYVAGICVAVRQIMPDHLIFKTRYGKLTNRNVPLMVLFLSLVFWMIKLLDGTYPAMFASGLLVSWSYLRFYQRHPNGRGDSSESFTFASFFPQVMQPVISILTNPLYKCCLKMGIVKPPAPSRISSSTSLTSVSISMPGVDPHDVERRRQIALKALSERLKTTDNMRHTQLPKSFPTVAGTTNSNIMQHHSHAHGQTKQHHHQHQGHLHHHQHQHHHHTNHEHNLGLLQQHQLHQHQHQHHHNNNEDGINTNATFFGRSSLSSPSSFTHHQHTPPITTARTEPRILSTFNPIAIPMPAPPPPPPPQSPSSPASTPAQTSNTSNETRSQVDADSTTLLLDTKTPRQ